LWSPVIKMYGMQNCLIKNLCAGIFYFILLVFVWYLLNYWISALNCIVSFSNILTLSPNKTIFSKCLSEYCKNPARSKTGYKQYLSQQLKGCFTLKHIKNYIFLGFKCTEYNVHWDELRKYYIWSPHKLYLE